jgi:hypothetical protein
MRAPFLGPGVYTERENALAITRGEYLKAVAESPEEWCGAQCPTEDLTCRLPDGHSGRHEWQRLGR